MTDLPLLLPYPRTIHIDSEPIPLPEHAVITIAHPSLLFEAQMLQKSLQASARRQWSIVAGSLAQSIGAKLLIDPSLNHAQSYQLSVTNGQIIITGNDHAGVYYGVCTLQQLIMHYGVALPNLAIEDYPDFPVRGVMLDISRDKVMTLETMYGLVDLLASWKLNQLQLYMEHSFAYSQHPDVWREASPITGQEILELDAYCHQRHIDLVPNQNSLGHMERWVKHARYNDLAECPDGFIASFGDHSGERRPATSLNPTDPRSAELMKSLYDELLPHFTSSLFNVGGDEPWEMGLCKSKEACDERGRGRVYVDHLLKMYELAKGHGRQMMFWADVVVKYPELIPEIPKDVIALEWGYYMGHPYADHSPMFAASGLPFYVCPGTSSWNTLSGRTENAIGNIRDAAQNGMQYGASGLLMTDWGDRGHWQPLPISYLGFAYGMAVAWAYDANENIDMPALLDRFVFHDAAGVMGKLVYDLGNIYKLPGLAYPNGSLLFFMLQLNKNDLTAFIRNLSSNIDNIGDFGIQIETMNQGIKLLNGWLEALPNARMNRPDASLIIEEFTQVIRLLRHACQRGLYLKGEGTLTPKALLADLEDLFTTQRLIWLARNRSGGLKDSVKRFEPVLAEYRAIVGELPSYL